VVKFVDFPTSSLATLTGVRAQIPISSVKVSDTLSYLGVHGSVIVIKIYT